MPTQPTAHPPQTSETQDCGTRIPCPQCRTPDGELVDHDELLPPPGSRMPWEKPFECTERYCDEGWLQRAPCNDCGEEFDSEELTELRDRWIDNRTGREVSELVYVCAGCVAERELTLPAPEPTIDMRDFAARATGMKR